MLDKIPPSVAEYLAPTWVWLISVLGALVGYLEDFHPGDTWPVRFMKGATRLSSSALAAVLTYHALLAMDVPASWHVVMVGIAGHMGVAALQLIGGLYKKRMGA